MDVQQEEAKLKSDAAALDAALRGDAQTAKGKARSVWARWGLLIAFVVGFIAGKLV